jgi:hypothetical protein
MASLTSDLSRAGPTSFGPNPQYCSFNRTVAGSPNTVGPLVPLYAGERVWDSVNFLVYQALTPSSVTWQLCGLAKLSGA